ncbi:hypothetical protein [Pseudomonas huanghezhanensis]|uniref:hypothetical protein n=1 Tax=Pseudomonas huanghezhanensis TaxID=3002903 RepID=UPI002286328A|nr:hypothetical protein [Pseudomonas sp. BSw22131]
MNRTSIYDRISEKRLALEEAAREQAMLPVAIPEPELEPEPVIALQDAPSSFSFGGFNLLFPTGFNFRDIQTTLEHEGEPIVLTIKRRDVRQGQSLTQMFEESMQPFRKLYPQLRIIRERDCTVAGNAAKSVDFHFVMGHGERHSRLVGALVPVIGRDDPQWLSISCVIDPTKPVLSLWLADFDGILDGLAVR